METHGSATIAGLNEAITVGELVAEPELRTLPSGSVAAAFSLTVRIAGHKTTSVPLVWYDPPKRMQKWLPGDVVVASGSVVRRFFRTAGGLGSATEVVVDRAVKAQAARQAVRIATATSQRVTKFVAIWTPSVSKAQSSSK